MKHNAKIAASPSAPPVRLLTALAALGALAAAAPYLASALGWDLDVASDLEVVDHVVPGAVVAVAALLLLLSPQTDWSLAALAGAALLAALWVCVTHVPLVADAIEGRVDWEPTLAHTVAAPPLLFASGWLVWWVLTRPLEA